MIKSDQPTIFNDDPLEVFVTSKSDGNMSFRSGHDTDKTPEHITKLLEEKNLNPKDIAGIRIEYDNREYNHILEFSDLREQNNLLEYASWVVTDAIVLTKPGKGAFLPIADCNGVVIYDPEHKILALAHIGWHASADNLPRDLIQFLVENHESNPAKLKLYISPSVRKQSYLVQQPAQAGNPLWENYLIPAKTGYYVDLLGFITDQFKENGIDHDNIEICSVDTAQSDDYFSHYMALQELDTTGRFAIMAVLK